MVQNPSVFYFSEPRWREQAPTVLKNLVGISLVSIRFVFFVGRVVLLNPAFLETWRSNAFHGLQTMKEQREPQSRDGPCIHPLFFVGRVVLLNPAFLETWRSKSVLGQETGTIRNWRRDQVRSVQRIFDSSVLFFVGRIALVNPALHIPPSRHILLQ